jgi:hypothetical protein
MTDATRLVFETLKERREFLGNLKMLLTMPVTDGPYERLLTYEEQVTEVMESVSTAFSVDADGLAFLLIEGLLFDVEYDTLLEMILGNL